MALENEWISRTVLIAIRHFQVRKESDMIVAYA
jgi:hypothetical protein